MHSRRFVITLLLIALLGGFAAFAWRSLPDAPPREPSGHAAHAADPNFRASGVVVSLDRAAGLVTLSHGPLQNLGMGPMTMGFKITDRAVLDALAVGARITFHADAVDGDFVATRIERVAQ